MPPATTPTVHFGRGTPSWITAQDATPKCPPASSVSNRLPANLGPASSGAAPERDRLRRAGLSVSVIQTVQVAKVGSTTTCYRTKLLGFQFWCEKRGLDPLSCAVGSVFHLLQCLLDRILSYATIKMYSAATSSCHEGFGTRPIFSHANEMKHFLHGVKRQWPVVCASPP